MELPILQQVPHIREVPGIQQQKNDILKNMAFNIVEFLEDTIKPKPKEKTYISWMDMIFYKNNRLLYIGMLFIIIALLLMLVDI